mmetsp:Transcript_24864/g.78650  ORF Transcript_24864/g.78650 Transcript_24864/m.78650 type:complete len:277 (-) Transcript_24864:607-1437(-)
MTENFVRDFYTNETGRSRIDLAHSIAGKDAHSGTIAYLASNCMESGPWSVLSRREEAYDLLVRLMHDNGWPLPAAGGACAGTTDVSKKTRINLQDWEAHTGTFLRKVSGSSLRGYREFFSRYKFNLVFENARMPGYISEKIERSFRSGAVPIYHGPDEIFEIFNKDAFIFMDMDNPEPALEAIRRAIEDEEVFQAYLKVPIFVPGAPEKYLSFKPGHGAGARLRDEVREALGLRTVSECGGVDGQFMPNFTRPDPPAASRRQAAVVREGKKITLWS